MTDASNPKAITFRDRIRAVLPRWLRRGLAEKLFYSIFVHADVVGDQARDGVMRRFPGAEEEYDSLAAIGRDRKIRRGKTESDETYATRLIRWLVDHQARGGPYAMLNQLAAYYARAFRIDLINTHGTRHRLPAVSGEITRSTVPWTPGADPAEWARWWLFYNWPTEIASDNTWADAGAWDDGGVWDSSLSPAEVDDLRLVPSEWNAAHAHGTIVLITPGPAVWDSPADTWDDGGTWDGSSLGGELWDYPEGTWDNPGVWGGVGYGPATIEVW